MVALATLGGPSSYPTSTNAAGQVVGWANLSDDSQHAFLWQNGAMVDLGTLGGSLSYATDINASGQVIGYSQLPGDLAYAPFLWENGSMVSLSTLGGTFSWPTDLNDAGQVVGFSYLPNSSAYHAFFWQGGVMVDLGTLGGSSSLAAGISASGQIIGNSFLADDVTERAFLWQGGVMVDLGTLGADWSFAYAINDLGQGAGFSADGVHPYAHAVLWTPGGCTTQITVGPVVELWPPDHAMRSFRLSDCASASDSCGGSVDIDARGTITSIFSDEPEDAAGNGDGHTVGDIAITGAGSFSLRSEREGRGNGRVYGVSFAVTDGDGTTQTATCHFAVPRDQSGSSAVNDGAGSGYTVHFLVK
jgi:probable HAF family extracellular repeat protein